MLNAGLISAGAGGAGGNDRAGANRSGWGGRYRRLRGRRRGDGGERRHDQRRRLFRRATSASDVLGVEAGSRFIGAIEGGGGAIDISGFGTVAGLGGRALLTGSDSAQFSGFGAYEFGPGVFDLGGASRLAAGQSLTIDSVLSVDGSLSTASNAAITVDDGGVLAFTGPAKTLAALVTNNGVFETQGARVTVDATLNGDGIAVIDGGSLYFGAGFEEGVVFTGKSGVLGLAKGGILHRVDLGLHRQRQGRAPPGRHQL